MITYNLNKMAMLISVTFLLSSCNFTDNKKADEIKLITLDPGHFHAALVQKKSYPNVSNNVYVYAPEGDELDEHLKKIEAYNNRLESPTQWNEIVYKGNDFFEKMVSEKKGNVVVIAGNNRKKTEYIQNTLRAKINVLADKPVAINTSNFKLLKECFDIAKENNVLLYDVMTERYEITTILQRELSLVSDIYGKQLEGTLQEPSIIKESVHHFYKEVSGNPLKRPAWFFDVEQEGEGIVDVTTHLVDLVQWEAFPDIIIDYNKDIEIIDANRWFTSISKGQFEQVTGLDYYPDYLHKHIVNDTLNVSSNGEIIYKIKGITAKVSVTWEYTYPKGGGDTHYSIMKGSKSNLIILQGKEQKYKPELFIEAAKGINLISFAETLENSISGIKKKYPGISLTKVLDNTWQINIPDSYRVGHEAHFTQVTENYLQYLKDGKLPDWEVPNMIAKYYITTKALEIAKGKQSQKHE
ncbi:Gfo/Idh/MocA family oxidoreductase [Dysgonomonas sp. Marseille-P4677]|uniref:putative oxidoreductase C-terminal domain-containing protein n=1 Tax=Dysgonomonas sp. Marseille-P4677 TaxID=2364790 RepID=UPI0019120CDC|nr:putative oxidoreductase C-terminal domain-containing protein [Dysgonomonas sp. Marseille-P4677]MBK5719852.1 Gfo/Idh/MocA family oxidoreductase [Dysgonomonas sp. Marseille-P4677]